MESFTIELLSKASVQLLPDKRPRFFTNFFQEQLNMEEQGEAAL